MRFLDLLRAPSVRYLRARTARRCLARRWDGMRCERRPNGHDGPHAANMTFRSPSTEVPDPAWWTWTDGTAIRVLRPHDRSGPNR